eukprot:5201566-Pleurochrysis_carterae.AAC.1
MDLRRRHAASRIMSPQCALGADIQKYTTLLVTPGLVHKLVYLESLQCRHVTHSGQCGGVRSPDETWLSRHSSAYSPDM